MRLKDGSSLYDEMNSPRRPHTHACVRTVTIVRCLHGVPVTDERAATVAKGLGDLSVSVGPAHHYVTAFGLLNEITCASKSVRKTHTRAHAHTKG